MILHTDIAIIGGGSAGLAAAVEAKKCGAKKVTLIERDSYLGGVLVQCVHNGFGLQYFGKDLAGPEYAARFIDMLNEYEIDLMMETMVLSLSKDRVITAVSKERGMMTIQAGAVILAMGCRERPRGSINIFGSRPAGIYTAGAAQRMINVDGFLPGKKIVLLGSGDIGMIMARRLTLANCEIMAAVEVLPYIGGLVRNESQCLKDFNIPVYLKHTVSEIHGNEHITGVTISEVDSRFQPIPGTEKYIECDTLLLSVGLIPENELTRDAGIDIADIGGPVVDENMMTVAPGIFAAGNVVHVHDLVDYISQSAAVAGRAAVRFINGELSGSEWRIKVKPGQNVRYVVPQHLVAEPGEGATLYLRVTRPMEKALLKLSDDLFEQKCTKAKPSEMMKIELSAEQVAKITNGELTVDCICEQEHPDDSQNLDHAGGIEVICTTCPMACRGRVFLDEDGKPVRTIGYRCPRGNAFAMKEMTNPERMLTGTMLTLGNDQPLLPVISEAPIPKNLMMKAMEYMADIVIDKPVKRGDVVVENILGTGVNMLASADYPQKR